MCVIAQTETGFGATLTQRPGTPKMSETSSKPKPAGPAAPQTRPTGQKRSLERGKSTRKKNAGKRAKQGG